MKLRRLTAIMATARRFVIRDLQLSGWDPPVIHSSRGGSMSHDSKPDSPIPAVNGVPCVGQSSSSALSRSANAAKSSKESK